MVNAGTHPEPFQAALGLARAGYRVEYVSGSQVSSRSVIGRVLRLLKVGNSRVLQVPTNVRLRIKTRGLQAELCYLVRRRFGSDSQLESLRKRTTIVERFASKRIARTRDRMIVVAQNSCADVAFSATSTDDFRVLMQPIINDRSLVDILDQDAASSPHWSYALQYPNRELSDEDRRLLLAGAVVAGSNFVAKRLSEYFDGPILVSNYASVSEGIEATVRRRAGEGRLRVLFAGQVNQRKGIGYAVEACARLHSQVELVVVGPIGARMRAELSRYSNVNVRGPVSREMLTNEYREAHVLLLPSLAEGFALVGVEAMQTGLPCIVTENTGLSDVVADGLSGFVVPTADSSAIADVLSRICNDDELLARVSSAATLAVSHLTWTLFGDDVARGIDEISRAYWASLAQNSAPEQ